MIKKYGYILELDSNAHTVFSLNHHKILAVKHRRKVINNAITNRAKEIFEYLSPKYIYKGRVKSSE